MDPDGLAAQTHAWSARFTREADAWLGITLVVFRSLSLWKMSAPTLRNVDLASHRSGWYDVCFWRLQEKIRAVDAGKDFMVLIYNGNRRQTSVEGHLSTATIISHQTVQPQKRQDVLKKEKCTRSLPGPHAPKHTRCHDAD